MISHLQYNNIELSFSIKLQEINLNLCDEYKPKRKARDENVSAKRADFLNCNSANAFQSLTQDPFQSYLLNIINPLAYDISVEKLV